MDHNSCSLNQNYEVHSDVKELNDLANAIKTCGDVEERLELCHRVLELFAPIPLDVNNTVSGSMELGHLHMIYHTITKVCADLHMKRGEYDDAYSVIMTAIRLDPKETGLLLDMAKFYKISNARGSKTILQSIRQHLNDEELKALDEILRGNE